jgi:hypothetical protein
MTGLERRGVAGWSTGHLDGARPVASQPMASASISLLADVAKRALPNLRTYGLRTTAVRSLRPLALLRQADRVAELSTLRTFRDHVLPRADDDPYFYSNNEYLFTGASPVERLDLAHGHHRYEHDTFVDGYADVMYGPGISLWSLDADGTTEAGEPKREHFELRLGRARHHLGEGPLTITLYVDEQDLRLMSLSFVDPSAVDSTLPNGSSTTSVFIGRHQFWRTDLSQNNGDTMARLVRQDDKNLGSSLFASNSAMHLCLAGVAGIALACGADALYGIDEARSLVAGKSDDTLTPNYSGCWTIFNATRSSPQAWRMPLPLDSTPIEQVSANKRRRARARRRLLDSIELSSFDALNSLRREPISRPELPDR